MNEPLKKIDIRIPKDMEESIKESAKTRKLVFRINQTEPMTEEYREMLDELFEGRIDRTTSIVPPLQIDYPSAINLGNNIFINNNLKCVARGGITIEDGVMIAPGVTILTVNHDLKDHCILIPIPVTIKKNAWIGADVTICPGVVVGEGAVIGAGAVVTKDVRPYTVVAGIPAKFIKNIE